MTVQKGRTARLNIRLTPEELVQIREAAKASEKSVSAFVLQAALAKAMNQSVGRE